MMKFIKPLFLIFLLLMVFEIRAFAIPIPIIDNSFEDSARPNLRTNGDYGYGFTSGWDLTGIGGTWTPAAGYFPDGIPNGDAVAFLGNGSSISQDLNHTVNAYNTLTLAVDVGRRTDVGSSGSFSIEILAGGNQLTSISYGMGSLSSGGFQTYSLSYNIENNDPFIGQPLSIAFHNLGALQISFDNVHFDNDSTAPVPEPATVLLFGVGLAGLAGYRKKCKR